MFWWSAFAISLSLESECHTNHPDIGQHCLGPPMCTMPMKWFVPVLPHHGLWTRGYQQHPKGIPVSAWWQRRHRNEWVVLWAFASNFDIPPRRGVTINGTTTGGGLMTDWRNVKYLFDTNHGEPSSRWTTMPCELGARGKREWQPFRWAFLENFATQTGVKFH